MAEVEESLCFHRAAADKVLQRLAVQEFHYDISATVLFADVVDCADVGVIERGGCFGFTLEAFERLRVVRHIFGKEFQSDGAVETSVLRFVDHTHAATPEFFEDAVMGNSLVEQRLGIWHSAGMLGSPWRHVKRAGKLGSDSAFSFRV